MGSRIESTAFQGGHKLFEIKEKNRLRRSSAPVQSSPSRDEEMLGRRKRPFSSTFPSSVAGTKGSHRQSLLILAANPGVLEGDSNVAERRSAGYGTFDGGQNCPADGQPKMAARDESGITNKGRPRSRPLSWTKRISQDFSNSADLAGKLKSVCSLPGAVSKDAGNMFIGTSLTSAKAFASYWKPPKVTNEHRRVASINKGTSPRASVNWHSSSIDARSPSIDSTWSSSSSRKSSLSSHSSFDKYSIKLNRHSLKMDRDGKEKDPGVVTTYGIDEFGPPVVAKYLLDF